MSDIYKAQIKGLVEKYKRGATESLIGYIADNRGLLDICRTLLSTTHLTADTNDPWLHKVCDQQGVNLFLFLEEIATIVDMFSDSDENDDPYAVLGVDRSTSIDGIKKAYRKLSIIYHPDTASENGRKDPEKFIQITNAYKKILGKEQQTTAASDSNAVSQYIWRQRETTAITRSHGLKTYLGVGGLVAVLICVSIIFGLNYRNKTFIAGLQATVENVNSSAPAKKITLTPVKNRPQDQADQYNSDLRDNSLEKVPEETRTDNVVAEAPETSDPSAVDSVAADSSAADHEPESVELGSVLVQQKADNLTPPLDLKEQSEPSEPEAVVIVEKHPKKLSGAAQSPETDELPKNQANRDVQGQADDLPVIVKRGEDTESVIVSDMENRPEQPAPGMERAEKKVVQDAGYATDLDSVTEPEQEHAPKVRSIEERVETFFTRYVQAYGERNMEKFISFFTDDAVENGKPFTDMVPQYEKAFSETSSASLNINRFRLEETSQGLLIQGRFSATLAYKNKKTISAKGPISFVLLIEKENFLISEVNYRFDS
ncbi:J domain-containing protein [Desulforhopalus singaporensis]|uniref:DnaJ domain-containing protein n=1 Tax=Desulforhopalus singaporensis TaxID=91360 RepID=A0A1H0UYM2_9BACT|nr:J domain-containing protein [Desulforhopalus singaporensis]SDP71211.1 DnaJ domain-containing protein [Desulforhopalus singaporensis]